MEVGTVFIWHSFPFPRYKKNEIKDRWFIYIGKTSILDSNKLIYLVTTTTSIKEFETGGSRDNHQNIKFIPDDSPFEAECILDIDERPYLFSQDDFDRQTDIEIKECLNQQYLIKIYNKISLSNAYSKVQKLDIYNCFIEAGIKNIKKPK